MKMPSAVTLILLICPVFCWSAAGFAEDKTITIRSGSEAAAEKHIKERKAFCSTRSNLDANKLCQAWLADQKGSLGKRLLTSHCSEGRYLYGKETEGCMAYISEGEITFLLNPQK